MQPPIEPACGQPILSHVSTHAQSSAKARDFSRAASLCTAETGLSAGASRINLRSPSQSRVAAAPICGHHRGPRRRLTDCSKIRTHWKIVIIFDHPRRARSRAAVREPRCNFAVRNSVQAFDDSTARRSAAAATRGPRLGASPARWASTTAPPAPEAIAVLSSAAHGSSPHHVFGPQNRGVVIQLLPATS